MWALRRPPDPSGKGTDFVENIDVSVGKKFWVLTPNWVRILMGGSFYHRLADFPGGTDLD